MFVCLLLLFFCCFFFFLVRKLLAQARSEQPYAHFVRFFGAPKRIFEGVFLIEICNKTKQKSTENNKKNIKMKCEEFNFLLNTKKYLDVPMLPALRAKCPITKIRPKPKTANCPFLYTLWSDLTTSRRKKKQQKTKTHTHTQK